MRESEQGILRIGHPEIDAGEVLRRLHENLAGREELPPDHASRHDALFASRREIERDLLVLREKVAGFGTIHIFRDGQMGKAESLVKRLIRRTIQRHIDQQVDVNGALLAVIDCMVRHMRLEDELLTRDAPGDANPSAPA